MIAFFLWFGFLYFIAGVLVAMMALQTPYADNGALIIVALWPLFAWALGPLLFLFLAGVIALVLTLIFWVFA